MPALQTLNLNSNQLRALRADMFKRDDFPTSRGTLACLELYLYDNPLHCDTMLCWLKAAAESGSVYFDEYAPECANLKNEA